MGVADMFKGKDKKPTAQQRKFLRDLKELKGAKKIKFRLQLNVTVDSRIKERLKRLKNRYNVDRDVIAEHALQTGCYYMEQAAEDEKRYKQMREHLLEDHANIDRSRETDAMLRLGEGKGEISAMLQMTHPILKDYENLQRVIEEVEQSGNRNKYISYEKQLVRKVILFAGWLQKNFRP